MATLLWSQFPLGSDRPWSWSLLVLLIAASWLVWLPSALIEPRRVARAARLLLLPGLLFGAVLVWAAVQTVGWSPSTLHNGLWQIAPGHAAGAVSVNPYETATEAMKLGAYVVAGALAVFLSRRHETAHRLYLCIVAGAFFFAVYGLYLSAVGSSQSWLLTGVVSPYGRAVSGGFVSKNSFATFDAVAIIACAPLIAHEGAKRLLIGRGLRRFVASLVEFLSGKGALPVIAFIVMFVALLLSDSRGGLLACLAGLFVLFALGVVVARRRRAGRIALAAGLVALGAMAVVFMLSGDSLAQRFDLLVETRGGLELRPVMWSAALQAIAAHPYAGSGLGTFRDVYPLFADRFIPFIVNRVHSDYLELALGLGIPAAAAWVAALLFLVGRCVAGVVQRHRRRMYAAAAIGAAAVVGVHSLIDFSLQMPAVSLLFATVLGIGVAQSMPSEERA